MLHGKWSVKDQSKQKGELGGTDVDALARSLAEAALQSMNKVGFGSAYSWTIKDDAGKIVAKGELGQVREKQRW